MFQVAIQPEETLFVFDRGLVRHIYTDGRPHPSSDDMWPTPVGDSIGHWEKQTLVIDTIGRTAGPVFLGRGADLSEAAHFVERVRRIGRDVLEDQLTITDPLRFVRPWQMTITYSRIANLDRMIPWDCANDRISSVDGKLIDSQP